MSGRTARAFCWGDPPTARRAQFGRVVGPLAVWTPDGDAEQWAGPLVDRYGVDVVYGAGQLRLREWLRAVRNGGESLCVNDLGGRLR